MLVLTRKLGETICVGDDIEITLVKIDRTQIRIGIKAPQEVQILRKELKRRLDEETKTNAD